MWILTASEDQETGPLTFRLSPGALKTIGRAKRADFLVDAHLVSRVHCRLTATTADQLLMEDLGSTNGTYVNGRRIAHAFLVAGDRLRVGRVELVVRRTD